MYQRYFKKEKKMSKAYEISIWKPHAGKRSDFLKSWAEISKIFKDNGVSDIVIMHGHAGKDVGNIVIVQTFKSLTDNGVVNDAIGESAAMKAWIEKNKDMDSAAMVSHDLYTEAD
jgi:creatinine amidohydrolase/Fe(II)-dependent formamide hydrolase-like protein